MWCATIMDKVVVMVLKVSKFIYFSPLFWKWRQWDWLWWLSIENAAVLLHSPAIHYVLPAGRLCSHLEEIKHTLFSPLSNWILNTFPLTGLSSCHQNVMPWSYITNEILFWITYYQCKGLQSTTIILSQWIEFSVRCYSWDTDLQTSPRKNGVKYMRSQMSRYMLINMLRLLCRMLHTNCSLISVAADINWVMFFSTSLNSYKMVTVVPDVKETCWYTGWVNSCKWGWSCVHENKFQ